MYNFSTLIFDEDAVPHKGVKGNAMNVCVLEDNPAICGMMRELLELRGHHVTVYTTGWDCLEVIGSNKWTNQSQPFDLLLVDLLLPDEIQGVEVLAQMQLAHPHIPLVVISAVSSLDLQDIQRRYQVEVLQKPFKMRDLLALIERDEHTH